MYRNAKSKGLYKDVYAGSNAGEYWAEIGQAYFDCNRVNNWNHGPVGTREQLQVVRSRRLRTRADDVSLAARAGLAVCVSAEASRGDSAAGEIQDRPVLHEVLLWPVSSRWSAAGRATQALLKANDTIRKMFAYRHDILKALINDDVKLVVLGRDEHLADLPEYQTMQQAADFDLLARVLTYSPEAKLLVVGEENVMADPAQPNVGDNQVDSA